ncbi:MAG: Imm63 family immunity protein [Candidatus Saccharibacteria bacterium]
MNSKYTVVPPADGRFVYSPNQWMASFLRLKVFDRAHLLMDVSFVSVRLLEVSNWESIIKRIFHALETDKEPSAPEVNTSNALEQSEYFGNKFHSFHEFVHKVRARSSLLKIKRKINQLQRIINAPKELRPSYGAFEYVDSYFIEIDTKGVMRLIETENGRIHEVRRTKDLDELLYWIFTNITFAMACKREMETGTGEKDRRIGIFLQQEELLGKLYQHWQDRKHAEYEAFMKNHPKDDTSPEDISYCEALRKLIRSETVENASNYFKY